MDSKQSKPEKAPKPTRRRKKALSTVGLLTLGATLPIVPQSNATVAERIARIRDAFANSETTRSAVKALRADLVTSNTDGAPQSNELLAQFGNFADAFGNFGSFANGS